MGKKGGWFAAVKKALSPESKEKKDQVWIDWSMPHYLIYYHLIFFAWMGL